MGVIVKNKLVVGNNEDYEYNEYLKSVATERPVILNGKTDVMQNKIENIVVDEPTNVEVNSEPQNNHNHGIFLINKKEHLTKRSQYLNDLLTFENK